MKKNRRLMIGGALALVLVVTGLFVAITWPTGVSVEVTNAGTSPVKELIVHVTGNTHRIGDLEPGESKEVRVAPSSESHVELEWKNVNGRVFYETVDCYFEASGYNGCVSVTITDSGIGATEVKIDIGLF